MLNTIKTESIINTDINTAWDFFSNPANLQLLTPDDMNFKILSELPEKMYAGMIIAYKVKPIPLLNFNWVTEITQVKEKEFFIDEQRFGPYKFWHHQHFFEEIENGVLVKDEVNYLLPYGIIGKLALPFVKSRLNKIFDFREKKMKEIFL